MQLREGRGIDPQSECKGNGVGATTIPFDSQLYVEYMEMVVRGLAWDHWKLLFDDECLVIGGMIP